MSKAKLLYVEDEFDLGNVTTQYLELMDFSVDWFTSANAVLKSFHNDPSCYQIVIIDIQLPDMDGFELARRMLHLNPEIYLLFLTARKEKADRLKGFKMGAVDYITKPFDVDELVLQLQNMLRHQPGQDIRKPGLIHIGDISMVKSRLMLSLADGHHISLTQREADLLEYLYQHRNEVVRREDILKDLWGDNDYFLGRSLDVFISRLRKLLKDSAFVEIENVYGVGFIFNVK